MRKRNLLLFVLVSILCFNFTVAMASSSYEESHNVLGGVVITKGQINSPTTFSGSTIWEINQKVSIYASTYTSPADGSLYHLVEDGNTFGMGRCTIDNTDNDFLLIGNYSITKIEFNHTVYSADESIQLMYYTRSVYR